VNVSAPAISGAAVEGQTLTAGTGIWEGATSLSYGYQWQRCNVAGAECANITGATASTHTIVAADLKHTLRIVVTASNSPGSVASTSAATTVVSAVAPLVYVSSFGSGLSHPCGVAVDPHGNVWVANSYANNIEKYSASGTLLATYGTYGTGHGEYHEPVGIAINQSTGNVYIADQNNNRVQELNERGEWVRTWGSEGSENGQFHEAENVAIGASGHVFVTDWGNDRVQVFEENGAYLSKFGAPGSGNGQFNGPSYIAIHSGTVYVGDVNNSRIQRFSEAGVYSGQSGSWGSAIGQYEYPSGIAFNASGKLFLADGGNSRIEEWSTTFSEFLSVLGTPGSGAGQLSEPEGLAFNSSGELFVADAGNDRIEKWQSAAAPTSTTPPSISGELLVGQILTAGTGVWAASPAATYTDQWERCNATGESCAHITGATSATYTLAEADINKTLRVAVTAKNTHGEVTSTSAIAEALENSSTTKYTYDAAGNLETVTDGDNHKTKYIYDADNEQTKIEDPNLTVLETGYDKDGQVTSQTDGNAHTTQYVRNGLEEITEILDPRERKTTKEYDKTGNLTKVKDAAGRTTTITYDNANRVTEISYSDGHTHSVKYEYNGDGKLTHMTDGTGETSYTYDQLDRLTESKNGHAETIGYEYNLANEPTKITYPNGHTVTDTYDNDNRLETVEDWLEHTTKFAYDPDSNPAKTTFPTGSGEEDTYAYNNADQQSEVKMLKGTETLAALAYARDNDDQVKDITSKSLPGEETISNTYDTNNRLTHSGTTTYEYNKADSPTKINAGSYTYSNANELETGPNITYTYNEVGQRTKSTPTTGSATTYGYDQAGNLITVERPVEGEKPAINDTYTYNGNNLRASQTTSGTTTYLAWDTAEKLPLLLNDTTNSYIYGPENLPIEQINNTTGEVLYLHHDQAGSTRLLTGSTGKTEATFTYGPYGELTGSTGTATTPLGYDAQYTSTDTGLIYLRNRVYDPKTAQFLSRDPLTAISGEPYSYAGDNPLNSSDPTGLLFGISLPSLEEIGEGIAGWGDTITFGGTEWVREQLGDNNIDACSGAYQGGGIAGLVTGALIPGEDDAEAEEGLTQIIKTRDEPGLDGGESTHIIEQKDGETISVTHRVELENEIIHQHQTHIGKYNGERQFPDEWIENPTIE
jgi:RHS repeat-associated protein